MDFHQELLDAGFVHHGDYYSYDFSVCGMNVEVREGRLYAEFQSEYDYEGDCYEVDSDNVEELLRDFHVWAII